ncbi:uncharacterized protein TNCV_3879401 [Trichonephila clavipes]|nr:uncharacterized protein TNCV_3879401 [Trichonephila clavipes]
MVNVDPYMDVESSQQEFIDRLFCPEPLTCLEAVRQLKNSVIGSNKQKGLVIQMGVLPRKSPNGTWKDYYFEIRAYFESWLNELKINSFDRLKNLMIADQMKKRCSPECKEHYLDIWEEISPEMLADKLEAFDIRRSLPSGPRRHVKASETVNDGRQVSFRKPERPH